MKFIELGSADQIPLPRPLTPQEEAELLELYKSQFDPVEAEREYREMIEKGGVCFDELLTKLRDVSKKAGEQKQ